MHGILCPETLVSAQYIAALALIARLIPQLLKNLDRITRSGAARAPAKGGTLISASALQSGAWQPGFFLPSARNQFWQRAAALPPQRPGKLGSACIADPFFHAT
jgi:hypothetical protein